MSGHREPPPDPWGQHPPMRVLRRFPARRALRGGHVVAALAVSVAGIVGAAWSVATHQDVALQGAAVLVAVAGLAQTVWQVNAALDRIEVAEPRSTHLSGLRATAHRIGRRPLLRRALLAGAGVVGLGGFVGLARFGPRLDSPADGWQAGTRLVTERGHPLRSDDIPPGGFTTAWPESASRYEVAAVMLVRLTAAPAAPTALDGVVDGQLLAYSKVCSHAGCPVGLFRSSDNALHCPCHHAEFDATRGAEPIAGPASRPLPQLPLGVDADGFLISTGGFTAPVLPQEST